MPQIKLFFVKLCQKTGQIGKVITMTNWTGAIFALHQSQMNDLNSFYREIADFRNHLPEWYFIERHKFLSRDRLKQNDPSDDFFSNSSIFARCTSGQ